MASKRRNSRQCPSSATGEKRDKTEMGAGMLVGYWRRARRNAPEIFAQSSNEFVQVELRSFLKSRNVDFAGRAERAIKRREGRKEFGYSCEKCSVRQEREREESVRLNKLT